MPRAILAALALAFMAALASPAVAAAIDRPTRDSWALAGVGTLGLVLAIAFFLGMVAWQERPILSRLCGLAMAVAVLCVAGAAFAADSDGTRSDPRRPAHRPVCVPVMIEMIPSLICARPARRR